MSRFEQAEQPPYDEPMSHAYTSRVVNPSGIAHAMLLAYSVFSHASALLHLEVVQYIAYAVLMTPCVRSETPDQAS